MKTMEVYQPLVLLVSILFILCTKVNSYNLSPSECLSQSDCQPGECCVFGMMRYSTAQCLPLGQVNDHCRTDMPPENRTLYFPNGDYIKTTEVYPQFCPCQDSLRCIRNECTAEKSPEDNYLYSSPKMISLFQRLFANT